MQCSSAGQFNSHDSLIKHVRTFSASNGYGISIIRSKPNKEILSSLYQNDPSISTMSQDVYNIRKKLHRENLKGHTPIQELVEKLDKKLMHTYSSVLLIDCTYKTNKFKLPLLNIVGVTSFNTTFFACFIFMKDEKREDYLWALIQVSCLFDNSESSKVFVTDHELALIYTIHDIFPNSKNILCRWHVEKNILTKSFSLRKIYEQYLKALQATSANSLEPCTNQSLNLDNIHHYWWIEDNQLLLQKQNRINDHSLPQLLQDFNQQYDIWLASQQTADRHKLSELIKEPMLLLDLMVQQHIRG
ncbi:5919_t:CDS:2 [Cetraspora pellucida]|uniref:5919_t:CDS:1 n=1 Tax=Cetraspora pellucida TaxID=1433469 RepID=A0A9N8Z297_9GLOM|nr:5919_t:CDS:2 [Cetraspora pellucida]